VARVALAVLFGAAMALAPVVLWLDWFRFR